MTLSEIRKNARESLSGKWGSAALLTFVFYLVVFGISIVYVLLSYVPIINIAAMVGFYAVTYPIVYGLSFCFIKLKRGDEVECGDFLSLGFSNFKRIWCIIGNILKKIWIYALSFILLYIATIFIIAFIIGFYAALNSPLIALFGCLIGFVLIAGFIALYVLLIIKSFLYVLSMYIAWDNPDMSAKEVVEKSEELMKGHRGEFFLLYLSFIGWSILAIFTLGIGMIWLLPYMETSFIIFYENRIKEKKDTEKIDKSKNEPEKLDELKKEMIEEKSEPTEEVKDTETENKVEINEESEENITEVNEEDIEKIDILDDEGNIIK